MKGSEGQTVRFHPRLDEIVGCSGFKHTYHLKLSGGPKDSLIDILNDTLWIDVVVNIMQVPHLRNISDKFTNLQVMDEMDIRVQALLIIKNEQETIDGKTSTLSAKIFAMDPSKRSYYLVQPVEVVEPYLLIIPKLKVFMLLNRPMLMLVQQEYSNNTEWRVFKKATSSQLDLQLKNLTKV